MIGCPDAIRLGLVGCGAISTKHVEAIGHLAGAKLVAVSDLDEARARGIASPIAAEVHADYRTLLDRKDVDAVIIATPSGLHASIALDALAAGKHVLVEKPMTLTIADADKVIAAAHSARRTLGVVHHNRFNRASQALRAAVDSGLMGRLVWGGASVKWYRPQDYYSKSGWRGTIAMDGGVLMNQAIHHIDLLIWIMGDVAQVSGFRATLGHTIEAEDTASIAVEFASGAIGVIDATTCAYPRNVEETVTVIGAQGSVVMGGSHLDSFRWWEVKDTPPPLPLESEPRWMGHYRVLDDFLAAIRGSREPYVNGAEARRALDLVLRIYGSCPVGRIRNGRA